MNDESWNELCATFSVKDHTYPGAFIAEVLLYDRLIIPVVPRRSDGLSDEEARYEWDRWRNERRWDPARQTQLVGILQNKLKERVLAVPWTRERQAEWAQRVHPDRLNTPGSIDLQVQDGIERARRDGYFLTGDVLQAFAPQMAKTVVAVSSCRSLDDLEKRMGMRRTKPWERLPASSLMSVLGFELFVPNNPDRNDFELLDEAAEMASGKSYREKRTALYLWQQQFIKEGLTDAPSIEKAVEEMRGLVEALKRETKWRWFKRIFTFFKMGTDAAKVVSPLASQVGGALATVGTFAADEALGRSGADCLGRPAASLVLDAQRRLNLTVSGDRRDEA